MTSILTSIKKLLGIPEDHTEFDADIIIHINTVLMVLNQIGIGPPDGFTIDDDNATWEDLLGEDNKKFEIIKTYVYSKVKLLFDPPISGSAMTALEKQITEFEWRLYVEAEEFVREEEDSDE